MSDTGSLKEWIRREMTMEKADILVIAKERVSHLVGVSPDGAVSFKLPPDRVARLTARDKVALYFIGKLYALAGEYAENDWVTSSELVENLGLPEGTIRPALKTLRDSHCINAVKEGVHSMVRNRVLGILAEIEAKVT